MHDKFPFAKLARYIDCWNEEPIGFLITKSSAGMTEEQHKEVVDSFLKHMPKHKSNILYEKHLEGDDDYEIVEQSWIFVRLKQPQHYNTCVDLYQKVQSETQCDYGDPTFIYVELDAKVLEWSIGQHSEKCDFDMLSDVLSHLPDKPCVSWSISIMGTAFDEDVNEMQTLFDTYNGAANVRGLWERLRDHMFETNGPVSNPIAGFDWFA